MQTYQVQGGYPGVQQALPQQIYGGIQYQQPGMYQPQAPQVDMTLKMAADSVFLNERLPIAVQNYRLDQNAVNYLQQEYQRSWLVLQQQLLSAVTVDATGTQYVAPDTLRQVLDNHIINVINFLNRQQQAAQLQQQQMMQQAIPIGGMPMQPGHPSYYQGQQFAGTPAPGAQLYTGQAVMPGTQDGVAAVSLTERRKQQYREQLQQRQQEQAQQAQLAQQQAAQQPVAPQTGTPVTVAAAPTMPEVAPQAVYQYTPDNEVDQNTVSVPQQQTVEEAGIYTDPATRTQVGSVSVTNLVLSHNLSRATLDILHALPLLRKYPRWAHLLQYPEVTAVKLGEGATDGLKEKFEQIGKLLAQAQTIQEITETIVPVIGTMSKSVGDYLDGLLKEAVNKIFKRWLVRADNSEFVGIDSWTDLTEFVSETSHPVLTRLKAAAPESFYAVTTMAVSEAFKSVFGSAFPRLLDVDNPDHLPVIATADAVNFRIEHYVPRDYGILPELSKDRFKKELKQYLVHVQTKHALITNLDLKGFKNPSQTRTVVTTYTHPMHTILSDLAKTPIDLEVVQLDSRGEKILQKLPVGRAFNGSLLIF